MKVVVVMVMMMILTGLFLNSPPEVKEIIDGARELERTVGVVAVNLASFV